MTASITRHRKSRSLRVASSAENSTSSVNVRASLTAATADVEALLARDAQLRREVEIGGGEERVNARPRSAGGSARAASSMSCARRPRQRGDDRPPHVAGNLPHRLGIGRRRDRKAGLDDVHAERVERTRHGQLRRHVHREAGRLLAVAQGRIEDDDACGRGSWILVVAGGRVEVKVIMINEQ